MMQNYKRLRSISLTMIITGLLITAGILYFIINKSGTGEDINPQGNGQPENIPAPGVTVSIKGIMVCLPHKNQNGPQTLECAIGLKSDDGIFYGLSDSDPGYKNVSGAGMGQRVEVSGVFNRQEETKYQSVGIIAVSSISGL